MGTLVLALVFQPRGVDGTIYIRADGSVDPDTGAILRIDNVTYAFTGNTTYPTYEGLVVERSDIVVDGNGYTLQGNCTVESGTAGILLSGVENVTIRNVEIRDFEVGVWLLDQSNHNSITGNNITGNSWGVYIWESSSNNIARNKITNNSEYGIISAYSRHNRIVGNDITSNGGHGISFVRDDSDNEIAENRIVHNTLSSVDLSYSSNNSIVENSMTNNQDCIILDGFSSNNTFFHNKFINNTRQAYVSSDSENNTWDNGLEGNYWSDYSGIDSDLDGIGDTPYIIDDKNTDNHPLMSPYWHPCDINFDKNVDMKDIVIAEGAYASELGGPLWNPHADITGPEHPDPDGEVDMRDISLIGRNFESTYTKYLQVNTSYALHKNKKGESLTSRARQECPLSHV